MKKSNLLLILIILAVFAIVFTCVSCQKDEKYNWKVKTKVIIVPSELFGVNAAVTLNIPDFYQDNMTRKEMDAYEYDRTFNGFMQLGDSVSKFY